MDRGCSSTFAWSSCFLTSTCCLHFDPPPPTPAGYQKPSPEDELALENAENLTSCREGDDGQSGSFNGLSSAFLAINQR